MIDIPLTKREYVATMCLNGILPAYAYFEGTLGVKTHADDLAVIAVRQADALLAELDKDEKTL